MCNRNKIVINGCSGACCEKFTLPVSMNDMLNLKEEIDRVNKNRVEFDLAYPDVNTDSREVALQQHPELYTKQRVLCENGFRRLPPPEDELNKIMEMLIPLGITDTCPQSETSITDNWKHCRDEESGEWDTNRMNNHFLIKDDRVHAFIYTCKHFDTENRICTNYENRPLLCRNFGDDCHYKGCGFTEKLKQAEEKAKSDLKTN